MQTTSTPVPQRTLVPNIKFFQNLIGNTVEHNIKLATKIESRIKESEKPLTVVGKGDPPIDDGNGVRQIDDGNGVRPIVGKSGIHPIDKTKRISCKGEKAESAVRVSRTEMELTSAQINLIFKEINQLQNLAFTIVEKVPEIKLNHDESDLKMESVDFKSCKVKQDDMIIVMNTLKNAKKEIAELAQKVDEHLKLVKEKEERKKTKLRLSEVNNNNMFRMPIPSVLERMPTPGPYRPLRPNTPMAIPCPRNLVRPRVPIPNAMGTTLMQTPDPRLRLRLPMRKI